MTKRDIYAAQKKFQRARKDAGWKQIRIELTPEEVAALRLLGEAGQSLPSIVKAIVMERIKDE